MSKFNPTPKVDCKYGAPMGRPSRDWIENDDGERIYITVASYSQPFRLVRVRIDSGGYDSGGAYWGLGDPLYYYEGPISDICGYVRGRTREEAKLAVRSLHPEARFFK